MNNYNSLVRDIPHTHDVIKRLSGLERRTTARLERYTPPTVNGVRDGKGYNVRRTNDGELRPVSEYTIRGGKLHGLMYYREPNPYLSLCIGRIRKTFGQEVVSLLEEPTFYTSVALFDKGALKKRYGLSVDPHNINNVVVVYKESLVPTGNNLYTRHGKFLRITPDRAIIEVGDYHKGAPSGYSLTSKWGNEASKVRDIKLSGEVIRSSGGHIKSKKVVPVTRTKDPYKFLVGDKRVCTKPIIVRRQNS